MIRRLHMKKNISKKKKYFPAARVVLFYLTRPTGNDFLLKGGLIVIKQMGELTIYIYIYIYIYCFSTITILVLRPGDQVIS